MAPTESTASCRYPRLMAECVENYLSSSSAPSRPPEEVSHLDAGVGASPLLERVAPVGELATHVASEVRAATEIALTSLTEVNDGVEQLMAIVEVARGVLGETNRGGEFETLLAESGYLELSSSLRELTEESVAGVRRIGMVVAELQRFTDTPRHGVEEVDLNDVVRSAVCLLQGKVHSRCELELSLAALPKMPADRGKLTQVVLRLIDTAMNCFEGSRSECELSISTQVLDGHVELRIMGDGGVPGRGGADRLRHSMPPSRLSNPDLIALNLTGQYVSDHGGLIRVEPCEPGQSCSVVELPVKTARAERITLRPKVIGGRARVLLVDDEVALLRAYQRVLRRTYSVTASSSAMDALDHLWRGQVFDVILCDLSMPDMDGPAFYVEVKKIFPAVADKIVFCSGGAFTREAQRFLDNVSNTVLDKPLENDALLAAMRMASE